MCVAMKLFVVLDTPLVFVFIRCKGGRCTEISFFLFAILNAPLVFLFIHCTARGLFAISDTTPVFVSCVAKPELR